METTVSFNGRHQGRVFRAVWFNGADRMHLLQGPWPKVDLAYHLGFNDFRGTGAIELEIRDLKSAVR